MTDLFLYLPEIEEKAEELVDQNYHTEAEFYFDLAEFIKFKPTANAGELIDFFLTHVW